MKNWIKSLFMYDKDPMKTIIWTSIILSVILHVCNAPAWLYIVLTMGTILLYIIVTSD